MTEDEIQALIAQHWKTDRRMAPCSEKDSYDWGFRRGVYVSKALPLVYLACPYTHPDPSVRAARFDAANRVAAELMRQGLNVFSPVTHCHPVAQVCDLPTDWEFWAAYDQAFISCCRKLFVLMLDGWKESVGVQAEIKIAEGQPGCEIEYIPAPS